MIFKRKTLKVLLGLFLVVFFASCGASSTPDLPEEDNKENISPQDIQPDIHTNVPPPGTSKDGSGDNKVLQAEIAQNFFDKKETQDKFSDSLRDQISQTMDVSQVKAGDAVFPTILGNVIPSLDVETGECDPAAEFLCIDSPKPTTGFDDIFTIYAGIEVTARIDLTQLAVFGPNDPVAVVSVFNNELGGGASEVLIMPEDIMATSDPNVGQFQTAVALGGAGQFTVVVSSYKNINDGESNELVSKMFNVFRTVAPDIDFLEARTVIQGLVSDSTVETNATVNSESLRIKVQLMTPFSPGVQVRFKNHDEAGFLKGFDAVGYVSPKEAAVENGEWVYTGEVVLHQGLNEIQIEAANPELEKAMGDEAPPPRNTHLQCL